jgi:hypothetical protein
MYSLARPPPIFETISNPENADSPQSRRERRESSGEIQCELRNVRGSFVAEKRDNLLLYMIFSALSASLR